MTPRTPATPASDTVSEKCPAKLPCTQCWESSLKDASFRSHYTTHCKILKDTSRPWVCAFTGISFDNKSEIIDWLRSWTHDRLVSVMMKDGSTSTVLAWVWITTYREYAKERQRLAANPNTRSIAGALDQQITGRALKMSRLPMVRTPLHLIPGSNLYNGNSSPQPPTGYGQEFSAALTYSTVPQPRASQNREFAAPFDTTSTQPNFHQASHGFGNLTGFGTINDPAAVGGQPNYHYANEMMRAPPYIPEMVTHYNPVASPQNALGSTPQQMGGPSTFQTAPAHPSQQHTAPSQPLHMNAPYDSRNFHSPQSMPQPSSADPIEYQDETTRRNW